MAGQANTYGLTWDFVVPRSLEGTQQWVLTTMQRNGPELVTMLWRILGNEQDVCDSYQDTFLNLAHYQGGQKPQNIRAYVFRTAANTAISILRRKTQERKFTRNLQPKIINPPDELNSEQLRKKLRECMTQLPESLRNVIILRDLGEMSYQQVGQMLGITAASARVYRHKAIQLLSVWMNRKEE